MPSAILSTKDSKVNRTENVFLPLWKLNDRVGKETIIIHITLTLFQVLMNARKMMKEGWKMIK